MEKEKQETIQEKMSSRGSSLISFFKHKEDGLEYKTINLIIKVIGTLVGLALLIFILQTIGESVFQPLFTFLSILSPFIAGIVFAWLLTPVESALVARDMKPTTAAFVVTVIGVFLLMILFGGFAYVTASSIIEFLTGGRNIGYFINTGKDVVSTINEYINSDANDGGVVKLAIQGGVVFGLIERSTVVNSSTDAVINTYELIIGTGTSLTDVISSALGYFYKFVISAVVVGFMLPNFSNFGNSVKSIIPKNVKSEWSNFIDIVGASFTDYMRGALMIASIVGSVIAVGIGIVSVLSSTIFYTPGSVSILSLHGDMFTVIVSIIVFGILCALTNLIPYAGPFIGGIPIVILVVLNDQTPGYWVSWAVAGVIVVTQSLESLFLQPVVMGRATRMHPVAILLGLTIFGSLFGIVGMLVSTPILSVGKSVINYYNEKYDIF
ncbi:AI-2E family transporter [Mycoplasmatota bacterium zrk1]